MPERAVNLAPNRESFIGHPEGFSSAATRVSGQGLLKPAIDLGQIILVQNPSCLL